jgi:hypothetical protein
VKPSWRSRAARAMSSWSRWSLTRRRSKARSLGDDIAVISEEVWGKMRFEGVALRVDGAPSEVKMKRGVPKTSHT